MEAPIKILDHGYIRFIESWGHGDAGAGVQEVYSGWNKSPDYECGIIEAARQSTQGSFRGWEEHTCPDCGIGTVYGIQPGRQLVCPTCNGTGRERGDAKLLRTLFLNKPPHATPFEFAGMVIEVQAPIFVFREWHRHRTQSYNEMSARYAPLPNNNYVPTVERCLIVNAKNKQAGAVKGSDEVTHESALAWLNELDLVYDHCERVYQSGLKRGLPKEVARICVPVGRYTKMRASTNLRNWLAFMTLRNDPGAQIEIQDFAKALATIIERKFPRTWALYVEGKSK